MFDAGNANSKNPFPNMVAMVQHLLGAHAKDTIKHWGKQSPRARPNEDKKNEKQKPKGEILRVSTKKKHVHSKRHTKKTQGKLIIIYLFHA